MILFLTDTTANAKTTLIITQGSFIGGVMEYGRIGNPISRSMDDGTEQDTRRALSNYIMKSGYNSKIVDYINNRVWNENTNEKKQFINILED